MYNCLGEHFQFIDKYDLNTIFCFSKRSSQKSAQTRGVHGKNSSLDPKGSFRGAAIQTNI